MAKEKLLIIEDEASVARQLRWSLGDLYDITIAADGKKARHLLSSQAFPVATLDLGLPPSPDTPLEGFKLLKESRNLAPQTKIIVITGNSEQENAIKAVAAGAVDFCEKPIDLNTLTIILKRTFRIWKLEEINRQLSEQNDQVVSLCGMLGVSPAMQKLFSSIRKVSRTAYPVLITGASGTGKEMVAHAIHQLSPRSKKAFVIINCAAIPENLLEGELFGHEKGAFTGAVARKIGKLEQADSGTVFLDEIGEMPLAMQVKILRFLQEGTIERVGGNQTLSVNARVIAATHNDLELSTSEGIFREDLYFRLNVIPIHLPPLNARREDIMMLAQHFLRREAQSLNSGRVCFSPCAISALLAHDWPGNIRELQNRIRRALSVYSNQTITSIDLGLEEKNFRNVDETVQTLQEARGQAEHQCIRQALLMTGDNISQAAKLLQISRPTLHDLLKKHGI